jgi:signal transduction histidine kinase
MQLNHRILKPETSLPGRVLIVEDEAELAEILEYNLIRSGFDVVIAGDGLEACRLISSEKPDLILLDLMLPLLDGWDVCRMLRTHQDPLMARIPVIMLSAMGTEDDRLKGYHLGADLYLPKPYVMKEVVLKARQLVEKRREYLALTNKIAAFERWSSLQDSWQHVLFHELKNQLTIISGLARHLNEKNCQQTEGSQDYLRHIQNSSDYLESLAMNYLLVRQVETIPGQLQAESIKLGLLFNELAALFLPLANQAACRLEFVCRADESLKLHPVGVKIILSSLIDNALKYSAAGGEVVVSAHRDAHQVEIQVSDKGPGIAAAEREKVFEKFYRSGAGKSGSPGSGLGLYMARALTESMGGTLALKEGSQPGCCFELLFPHPRDVEESCHGGSLVD